MRTLKHHSDAILNDELLDPALKTRLLPLLRGAQIQALEGAEAIDELKQSTVAAAASRTRSLQRRSTLQRGAFLQLRMRVQWFKTEQMLRLRSNEGGLIVQMQPF
jgi:serine/threonine-protein kinase RIO1